MKLLIISNAPIIKKNNSYFAYSPYVKEMEIWAKHADEVALCCPEWKQENGLLISRISFTISKIFLLSDFNVVSLPSIFKSIFQIIYNLIIIFKAVIWADHIHLRCPGNVGLLAIIVQMFFPSKIKTAKYAGNWDPKSKQPLTYKLQQYILNNSFLTRNMQVLVYGEWKGTSKNIKPFFTATYSEIDKMEISQRELNQRIKFVFVGTLVSGKRPLYAITLLQELLKNGLDVQLDVYGDGIQKNLLQDYTITNTLQDYIQFHGNQNLEIVKKAYQESHFVLLPSESEGWPKVLAEGMFWGCVPLATAVSCVPFLLDFGKRGIVLELNVEEDSKNIQDLITNSSEYNLMSTKGMAWSRKYTLDYFEQEIKLLLQP